MCPAGELVRINRSRFRGLISVYLLQIEFDRTAKYIWMVNGRAHNRIGRRVNGQCQWTRSACKIELIENMKWHRPHLTIIIISVGMWKRPVISSVGIRPKANIQYKFPRTLQMGNARWHFWKSTAFKWKSLFSDFRSKYSFSFHNKIQ